MDLLLSLHANCRLQPRENLQRFGLLGGRDLGGVKRVFEDSHERLPVPLCDDEPLVSRFHVAAQVSARPTGLLTEELDERLDLAFPSVIAEAEDKGASTGDSHPIDDQNR